MKKYTVIGIAILSIILFSSCHYHNEESSVDNEAKVVKKQEVIEEKMVEENKIMIEEINEEVMIKDDMTETKVEETMMKTPGVYKEYSAEALANSKGNIVLAFLATWCPPCKTTDKNLSSETIPEGLTVFKVDYDTYTDLRKKYGVTSQHAFVQIDNEGNEIKKWYGAKNSEDILEKIK